MLLEVDNIELSFNRNSILWGIYLRAEKGKITAILGRNGSGKTFLFNIIFGSLKAKNQLIRIDSRPIDRPLYQTIASGLLHQGRLLPKNISLKRAFQLYKVDWKGFLALFPNFKGSHELRASKLSQGQQRIIATYLVLRKPGEIVLLDEPFSFIAPTHVEKIKQLIQKEKEHKMILITDHYYRDVLEICDTLYFLGQGRLKPLTNPEMLVTNGYLKANR